MNEVKETAANQTKKAAKKGPAKGAKTTAPAEKGYQVPAWRKGMNIHQRVQGAIEALVAVGPIERESTNQQQSYRFASHNAIKEALTPILVRFGVLHLMELATYEAGIRVQPGSTHEGNKQPDKEVYWVRAQWRMQLVNIDAPNDCIVFAKWPSYAEDYADKADSKVSTLAEKTFLIRQFKITTAEDDTDGGVDQTRATRRPVPPLPARGQPTPAPAAARTQPPAKPEAPAVAAPAGAPSPLPPARAAAPKAETPAVTAPAVPAVAPPAPAEAQASAEAAGRPRLTQEQLLWLAMGDKLSEQAIKLKIRSAGPEGFAEVAQWVAKNHRSLCPICSAREPRISLMIEAHRPQAANAIEVDKTSDLPPLAG